MKNEVLKRSIRLGIVVVLIISMFAGAILIPNNNLIGNIMPPFLTLPLKIITGLIIYTDKCIGSDNGFTIEYLDYLIKGEKVELSFKVINDNDEDLSYAAFEIINQAIEPINNSYYTTKKYEYKVENPINNFIQFELTSCVSEKCDKYLEKSRKYLDKYNYCISRDKCDKYLEKSEKYETEGKEDEAEKYYGKYVDCLDSQNKTKDKCDKYLEKSEKYEAEGKEDKAEKYYGKYVDCIGDKEENEDKCDKYLEKSEKYLIKYNDCIEHLYDEKVIICHHPPGNPENCHTLEVKGSAVSAHLEHGDYLGNCTICNLDGDDDKIVTKCDKYLEKSEKYEAEGKEDKAEKYYEKYVECIDEEENEDKCDKYLEKSEKYGADGKEDKAEKYYGKYVDCLNKKNLFNLITGNFVNFKNQLVGYVISSLNIECSYKNGDYDIFTYTISLDDFNSMDTITAEAKAGDNKGTVVFSNPCLSIICADKDNDGFNITGGVCGPIDCNDNNALIYPGQIEDCYNYIDDDCDGFLDWHDQYCIDKIPTVSIISPLDGSDFKSNDHILFSASAFDKDGVITKLEWYSNIDGLIGTGMTFDYSGLSVGEHKITAIVVDNESLSSNDTIEITIKNIFAPIASIKSPNDRDKFKQGTNIVFDGVSSDIDGYVVSYIWKSNMDGIIANTLSFDTSSLSAGMHTITFTAIDDDGLNSTESIHIEVQSLEAPTASILSPNNLDDFKINTSILFNGIGSDPDGSIVSYKWVSSINGVIGNSKSFTRSDLSPGLHIITLIVTDNDGLNASYSIKITVKSLNAPTVSILSPNDGDNFIDKNNILFSAIGSDPDGYITSWQWSSNIDGIIHTDGVQDYSTFSYSGLSVGNHIITLTVTDNDNLIYIDTFSVNIVIDLKSAPAASIVSPLADSQFKKGQIITFSGYGTDTNGYIKSYAWYSNIDGLIGTKMTFDYSSLSVGEHIITLIVTDNDNQTDSDSISLVILDNNAPTASITSPSNGDDFREGDSIIFNGYGDNGIITQYIWTSNLDGFLSNAPTFETSQLSVGEHIITLTVVNDEGQSDSNTITININHLNAPIVSIISPIDQSDYRKGQNVTFVGMGADIDGNIVSYYWASDIDGVIGNAKSFTKSDLSLGFHTITLIVTDNNNLTASDSVQISVKPAQAPTASIVEPNNGDVFKKGTAILFIGDGSDPDGEIVSWTWSSSIDGLFGTGQMFVTNNLSIGKHDITLTVIDDDEQQFTDTFTIWILVEPANTPTVTITSPTNNNVIKEGTEIYFSSNVSDIGYITSYRWSSDIVGFISNSPYFFKHDLPIGLHTITLTVMDKNNLSSSDTIILNIIPKTAPEAIITSPIGSVFKKEDLIIFSVNIIDDGNITSIVWNSNLDGNIGSGESFTIDTLTTGEHIMTVIVTDDENLTTFTQKTIRILPEIICTEDQDVHIKGVIVPNIVYAGYPVTIKADITNQLNAKIDSFLFLYVENMLMDGKAYSLLSYEKKELTFRWMPSEKDIGEYVPVQAESVLHCDIDPLDNHHHSMVYIENPTKKIIDVEFLQSTGSEGFENRYPRFVHDIPLLPSYNYSIIKIRNFDNISHVVNLTLKPNPPDSGNGNGIDSFNVTNKGPIQVNVPASGFVKVVWPYTITLPNVIGFYDLIAEARIPDHLGYISDTKTIEIYEIHSPGITITFFSSEPSLKMTSGLNAGDHSNLTTVIKNQGNDTAQNLTAVLELRDSLSTSQPLVINFGDVLPCPNPWIPCPNVINYLWDLGVVSGEYRSAKIYTFCDNDAAGNCNYTRYEPDREAYVVLHDIIVEPSKKAYLAPTKTVSVINGTPHCVDANITNYGELNANNLNVSLECHTSHWVINSANYTLINISNKSNIIIPFNATPFATGLGKTCRIAMEGNNISQEMIQPQIDIVTGWPELNILNVALSAAEIKEGTSFILYVTLNNNGTVDATNVSVRLYFDSTYLSAVTNPIYADVNTGQTITVPFTLNALNDVNLTTIIIEVLDDYTNTTISQNISIIASSGGGGSGGGGRGGGEAENITVEEELRACPVWPNECPCGTRQTRNCHRNGTEEIDTRYCGDCPSEVVEEEKPPKLELPFSISLERPTGARRIFLRILLGLLILSDLILILYLILYKRCFKRCMRKHKNEKICNKKCNLRNLTINLTGILIVYWKKIKNFFRKDFKRSKKIISKILKYKKKSD